MNTKKLLGAATLLAFIFMMQACNKDKHCTTCTATYNGSTVASREACSSDAEEEFRATYYYAETSCR